jgi:hypothetical protein
MDLDLPEFLILVLAVFCVVYAGTRYRNRRRRER